MGIQVSAQVFLKYSTYFERILKYYWKWNPYFFFLNGQIHLGLKYYSIEVFSLDSVSQNQAKQNNLLNDGKYKSCIQKVSDLVDLNHIYSP